MLQTNNLTPGTLVTYTNGSNAIYTGIIKGVSQSPSGNTHYTVIDHTDNAAIYLFNAGYNVGSYISHTQIKSIK